MRKADLANGSESDRPKLLFLSQNLPFPPDGGVKARSYHVLRLLARTFDVTALCFYRRKSGPQCQDVATNVAALGRIARVEAFPILQEHNRTRFVWDHLRSVATGRAYTRFVYESSKYRKRLQTLLRSHAFDIVHVDSLDLCGYLPPCEGTRVVCVHHNCESVLLSRRAEVEESRLRRAYLRHQARLTQREEENWCGRVSLNVTVSDRDKALLECVAPKGRYAVVPNGVDTQFFTPRSGSGSGMVFVGGTTWFPNRDALEFFTRQILPLLRERVGDVRIHWIGRATKEQQREFRDRYGVTLTGYVEDIRPYVSSALCYIAPLRLGGGTRLKILDAWGMGKAVVSTSIGCEGLLAVDGENILIRDTPHEFAAAVQDVLEDRTLRERLGQRARETAERFYSWEVIGEEQRCLYLSLLDSGVPLRTNP